MIVEAPSGRPAAAAPEAAEHAAPAARPGLVAELRRFSERFGNMLSRALLTLLYFLLLGPFAILYRAFADPLHIKRRRDGNWSAWTSRNDDLSRARKQD
jgi:hypothetical protein